MEFLVIPVDGVVSQTQMDYVNKVLEYVDVFTYKAVRLLEERGVIVRRSVLNIDLHPTALTFDRDNSVVIYFAIINGPGAFVRCVDNEAVSHKTEVAES